MLNSPEDLLTSIYGMWDLVCEDEKKEVNRIDDKLNTKGSLGSHEIKALQRLLRDLRNRSKAELQS